MSDLRAAILAAPGEPYKALAARLGCSGSYVLVARWKHRQGHYAPGSARAPKVVKPPPPPGARTGRPWTAEEDIELEALWGEEEISEIARQLGRNAGGLYQRAGALGLERGVPEGFESFNAACVRTGYDARVLARILLWAKALGALPPWRTPSRRPLTSKPRTSTELKGRQRAVDPVEVDKAVAAWLGAETRQEAARRLRCRHETLGAALDAAGLLPKRRRGQGRKLKLPPESFDRALAAWRARRTLAA